MAIKILFIAGVYGVGKSTLCNKLSNELKIPLFSASKLISEKNGETYGSHKAVRNKEYNQQLLIDALNEKTNNLETIILDGHFCIFNKNNQVEYLPTFVYHKLPITKIILLEANVNFIIENLQRRDNKKYAINNICELIQAEKQQAEKVAMELNVPLYVYQVDCIESNFKQLKSVLEGGYL